MGIVQQPAAGLRPPQGTDEPIDREDDLLEQWLARPRHSKPRRPSSWAPRAAATGEERAPLGDQVADAWFR